MSRSMPPAPFARRVWVGLAVALAGAVIGLGAAAAPLARALDGQEATFQKLSLFAEALRHIEANYVLPVRPEQLIYGAIGGMVATLDPHSEFLDPAQYREFLSDSEGRFAGIGVEIAVRDGWLTVLSVFRGGPAERAGLRPGDPVAVEKHGLQPPLVAPAELIARSHRRRPDVADHRRHAAGRRRLEGDPVVVADVENLRPVDVLEARGVEHA